MIERDIVGGGGGGSVKGEQLPLTSYVHVWLINQICIN